MSSMDVKNKIALAVGVGAALLSAAAAYKFYMKSSQWQKKNSKQLVKGWKAVGTVAALNIFPIKSCKGIPVDEAECMTLGLANERLQDRSFMIINDNNNFVHARIHPTVLLIKVNISGNQVELTGPNKEPITFSTPSPTAEGPKTRVRVWGDEVLATDCGDEVALWLSQYIFQKDTGARLVYFPYTDKSPRVVKPKPGHPWMRETDGAVFNDLTPYHLLSVESVNDFNSRLDGKQVSILNFRPTIIITGCKPYEEDEWRFVRIGDDAILRYIKGCDRCVLTTIDPETAVKDPEQEPLRTLRKYRLAEDPVLRKAIGESPLMGINLSLDQPGKIRVGDVVYAGQL